MDQENTYWIIIIGKYLSGEIDQSEEEQLADWLSNSEKNRQLFDEYRKMWGIEIAEMDSTKLDIEADWKKVRSNITTKEGSRGGSDFQNLAIKRTSSVIPMSRKIAAAAAIFLLSVLAYSLFQNINLNEAKYATVEYVADQEYPIQLPDGSKVWLNKEASIQFDEEFTERKVILVGEAFFEVVKNPESPFEVFAYGSTTRVLGTRFNVRVDSTQEKVDLFVEEGRVAFSLTAQIEETEIVTAGEAAVVLKKEQRVQKLDLADANMISWQTKQLNFEHQTMSTVLGDISKHFDISIRAENNGTLNCRLKADFSNPTLEEVLETISFSLNGTIEKLDNEYVIKAAPCSIEKETN